MQVKIYSFLLLLFFSSCSGNKENASLTSVKDEIAKAEKDFEIMAASRGIAEAFWFFAADDAVIKRGNDSLIFGRENIKKYYSAPYFRTASVKWSPDFIDVSEKADLAYTYGKYHWQSTDSTGKIQEFRGIFHTIWKKQKDGSWKYVWD